MHCCHILHFENGETMEDIETICAEWQRSNRDNDECGYDAPTDPIQWRTSHIFGNRKLADDYLDSTFGRYNQIAFRYNNEDGK